MSPDQLWSCVYYIINIASYNYRIDMTHISVIRNPASYVTVKITPRSGRPAGGTERKKAHPCEQALRVV
jgi:hypothetical protein